MDKAVACNTGGRKFGTPCFFFTPRPLSFVPPCAFFPCPCLFFIHASSYVYPSRGDNSGSARLRCEAGNFEPDISVLTRRKKNRRKAKQKEKQGQCGSIHFSGVCKHPAMTRARGRRHQQQCSLAGATAAELRLQIQHTHKHHATPAPTETTPPHSALLRTAWLRTHLYPRQWLLCHMGLY